jgi:outer membrane protein TolC
VAAEQELAWVERTVSAQVQAAYDAANKLSAQATRLQESFLSRAEEARRITLTAYAEGAASLLQVLDATRALGDARVTYYRILFEQRQSLLDLAAAIGEDPALTPRSIGSHKSSITGETPEDGQ